MRGGTDCGGLTPPQSPRNTSDEQPKVKKPVERFQPLDPELLEALCTVEKVQKRVEDALSSIQKDLAGLAELIAGKPSQAVSASTASGEAGREELSAEWADGLEPTRNPAKLVVALCPLGRDEDAGEPHLGQQVSTASKVSFDVGAGEEPGQREAMLLEPWNSDDLSCNKSGAGIDPEDRTWPEDIPMRFGRQGDEFGSGVCRAVPLQASIRRQRTPLERCETGLEANLHEVPRFVVHPASNFLAIWSTCGALLLLSDTTLTPLTIAWDIPVHGWLWTLAWVTLIFWTLDFFLCFITGFHKGGRLEMRRWHLAKHYLATWFALDLLLLTCEWAGVIIQLVSQDTIEGTDVVRVLRIGKTVKMLRVVGMMRITRLGKMASTLKFIKEVMEEYTRGFPISSQCCTLAVCALWLNHVLGCFWFAVGRLAPTDTGRRWIDFFIDQGEMLSFMEEGLAYQYTTSLHWSLAQFTLGANEISATNSKERLFNIVCLMIGLIFGSTLVSTLSAGMVDYHMRMMEKTMKLKRLQRYLRENKVGQSTALLVTEQAQERLNIQERLKEADVPVISMLSKSLQRELRYEISRPHLSTHPLFNLYSHLDNAIFNALCQKALSFVYPHQQDDLFAAGTRTDKAYRLVLGSMTYVQNSRDSPAVVEDRISHVREGSWLSEASLWSCWTHVGTAKARTPCQVLAVDAEESLDICQRHVVISPIASEYCRNYHKRIIVSRPPVSAWCSDLEVPGSDWNSMVASMEQDVRAVVSLCVVDIFEGSFLWLGHNDKLETLREDILSGLSCLVMDTNGHPERLVSKVKVRIENSDGMLFTRVGKVKADCDRGGPRACCKVPSTKLVGGETWEEAVQRLLLMLGITPEGAEAQLQEEIVESKQSSKFGLRTSCTTRVALVQVSVECNLPLVANINLGSSRVMRSFRGSLFSADGQDCDPSLLGLAVYKQKAKDRSMFYSWLPPERIEQFATVAGKKDLEKWLSHVKRCQMSQVHRGASLASTSHHL